MILATAIRNSLVDRVMSLTDRVCFRRMIDCTQNCASVIGVTVPSIIGITNEAEKTKETI